MSFNDWNAIDKLSNDLAKIEELRDYIRSMPQVAEHARKLMRKGDREACTKYILGLNDSYINERSNLVCKSGKCSYWNTF